MLLPNIFLEAFLDAQGSLAPVSELSTAKIRCPESNPQDVRTHFSSEFEKNWNEFWRNSVGCDEDDEELEAINELPVECSVSGDTVIIHVNEMVSRDEFESNIEYDEESLEKSLKSTKKKFPDVVCSGFVITDFSDEGYGEIYSEEVLASGHVSSKPTETVYPELGEVLRAALSETIDDVAPGSWALYGACADEIWEYIEENGDDDDYEALFKCFKAYAQWTKVEFLEKLLDIVEDDDLGKKIERYIDKLGND